MDSIHIGAPDRLNVFGTTARLADSPAVRLDRHGECVVDEVTDDHVLTIANVFDPPPVVDGHGVSLSAPRQVPLANTAVANLAPATPRRPGAVLGRIEPVPEPYR
ncbi:MAG: hypothetical protein JWR34_1787 [Mycobacterium sp.]|nr:hypothetical protein [Mycobacterium sp.]